jgi:site-specific DNA recombinase
VNKEPAGIWLRVSNSGQDEESQLPANLAWCESRGYRLAKKYTVHGRSAFKGNKRFDAAWAEVLSDIRSGVIGVLVVWKQDRIDRKLETFQMLAQVVEAGGRVEFVTQPHLNDLTTMGGRISLKVQEEIAYAESRDKSDRILAKHAALRRDGSFIGRPPYGYSIARRDGIKMLVIEEREASVIRDAARWYLDGQTLQAISDALNGAERLPRRMRNGKQPLWSPWTVSLALRSENAIGRHRHGGVTMKMEPVLDRAVWQAVADRMSARANRTGISSAEEPALLTSLIFCAACFKPMYRVNSGPSYYCRNCPKGSRAMARMSEADRLAEMYLLQRYGSNVRTETLVVPGHGHDDEIDDVKRDMADAVQAEDFARLAELQAELGRLRALPAVSARVVEVPVKLPDGSVETVADHWEASRPAERREMLRGILQAYYRPGWDTVRFTSGDLTPAEAIKRLAA